ncbi:hypothetical protein BFJ66_g16432 [Fusarium oxysporum f. sp. cepae]|nr:hypothetical protein BFJ66_g16432 [Fusarium oxysporum f. sp. cepae]
MMQEGAPDAAGLGPRMLGCVVVGMPPRQRSGHVLVALYAVIYNVASLTTALANWLSMTVAGKVVAPARLTLSGSVGFVTQSRRTAAKERPEPLCGLQKGYKQGLGQGAVRELSRRTYINRLKPRLDFYLITDNTVTIHLFTVKVGQSGGKVRDYIGTEKDLRMVHSIEMGWFILDKYYALVESTPVYAAAMLLDLSKRKHCLLQNWPEEWHQKTIDADYSIWHKEYAYLPHESLPAPAAVADTDTCHPSSRKRVENELGRLKRRLRVQPTLQEDEDTFIAFIEDKTINIDALKITPLQWWLVPQQRRRYPRLHRMAINILSIAPSSAKPEQQFSGARRTQSWDRLRLSPENLQRLECMGN